MHTKTDFHRGLLVQLRADIPVPVQRSRARALVEGQDLRPIFANACSNRCSPLRRCRHHRLKAVEPGGRWAGQGQRCPNRRSARKSTALHCLVDFRQMTSYCNKMRHEFGSNARTRCARACRASTTAARAKWLSRVCRPRCSADWSRPVSSSASLAASTFCRGARSVSIDLWPKWPCACRVAWCACCRRCASMALARRHRSSSGWRFPITRPPARSACSARAPHVGDDYDHGIEPVRIDEVKVPVSTRPRRSSTVSSTATRSAWTWRWRRCAMAGRSAS